MCLRGWEDPGGWKATPIVRGDVGQQPAAAQHKRPRQPLTPKKGGHVALTGWSNWCRSCVTRASVGQRYDPGGTTRGAGRVSQAVARGRAELVTSARREVDIMGQADACGRPAARD